MGFNFHVHSLDYCLLLRYAVRLMPSGCVEVALGLEACHLYFAS